MWYLCGLGSNIAPDVNLTRAITLLIDEVPWLWVSRVLRSEPVGMDSQNSFLNSLVVFWSDLNPEQLKARLNDMEEKMGRDRTDPERKFIDHTIDLDILEFNNTPRFDGHAISEPYFLKLFDDQYATDDELVSINFAGHEFGKVPVTILVAPDEQGSCVVKPSASNLRSP